MSHRFENQILSEDKTELFYQGWEVEHAHGSILIVHGQAEHSECYHEFATALNENQWNVYGVDLRGHGKSDGQRGYAHEFADYEKDAKAFIQQVKSQHHKNGPLILFGHSMGGLVCIKTLIGSGSMGFSALTLSSPALGFTVEVPLIKQKLANTMTTGLLGRITLNNEIKHSQLTSRKDKQLEFDKDPYRHDRISSAVFIGMKNGFELANKFKTEIKIPVLMQLSGKDPICSTPAAIEFFEDLEHIEQKKLIIYSESLHEILNDVEGDAVVADYLEFINQYI